MNLNLNLTETVNLLRENDDFLIITHRRPDGDTLGSAAGLALGLRAAGKTAYLLTNGETTTRYLKYVEYLYAPSDFVPKYVVSVDTAAPDLFPDNAKPIADSVELAIDHHPSNTGYAPRQYLDGSCAACGEIIYELLMELNGSISAEIATALYIAVSTDTGCFAYGNTTANSFHTAARLADAGAPIAKLNHVFFRTKSRNRVRLEGIIFSNLEFYFDGRVAISTVTNAMLSDAGTEENDVDDIASLPGSVSGVLVGITIRELSGPLDCKVSVRTNPSVNANALCARFGGGGHAMASGFSLDDTVTGIREKLLAALPEYLPA